MTEEACCLAVPYVNKIRKYFDTQKRPDWCPLKPVPAKNLDDLHSTWYSEGWNDCLKAIGGDE